jgi:hypothetical protein
LFVLILSLGTFAWQTTGSVHADSSTDAAPAFTASATVEQTVDAQETHTGGTNEAPVPTEIPGGTATQEPPNFQPTGTRTEPPDAISATPSASSSTGTPTQQPATRPEPWEIAALRDFAETVGWPPAVSEDARERLSVRKTASGGEDWLASIRTFDFKGGAEAAFSAEQEDGRLAGYQLSEETFYTFPAYAMYLPGQNGALPEYRYHFLVDAWILGVDVRQTGVTMSQVQTLARQLLIIAGQDGLPLPPGVLDAATPSPEPADVRTPEGCSARFNDVPEGMWAYSYITELACTHIVSGYRDGTFKPQNATTRAQLVKMVVLLQGIELESPPVPTFTDVGSTHTFYRFVETAASHHLIGGYGDGSFRPDAPVSRAQVAKIVVKARGWDLHLPTTTATLCDVPSSHWAYLYIQVAIGHGIFTGYGDGCFRPDEFATRAQLAKVLVLSHR